MVFRSKNFGKTLRIGIILGVFLIASVVVFAVSDSNSKENERDAGTIAWVNGEPIVLEEYMSVFPDAVNETKLHFRNTYNADPSDEDFWNRKYHYETPLDYVRKKALDLSVRNKMQFILMKEKGLIADISYSGFLQGLEEENRRRENAAQQGQVIFGPTSFSMDIYYRYIFDTGVNELKKLMAENELVVTDGEITEYYQVNMETYKKHDHLEIKVISAPYVIDRTSSQDMLEKAYEEICKVEISIKEDGFDAIDSSYTPDITIKTIVLGGDNYKLDMRTYPTLYPMIYEMNTGEVSGILNDNGAYNIVKIISREKSGYVPMEEEYTHFKKRLMDEKYDDHIDRRSKNAIVDINIHVYEQIQP